MGGSSFFGPGRSKNLLIFEELPHYRRRRTPPVFCPIFDPFFEAEDRRRGVVFDLRGRRSKIEDGRGSSIYGSEHRRWGVFDFRASKIEKPPHLRSSEPEDRRTPDLRSSEPKIEESLHLRFSTPKIEEPPIFVLLIRRPKNPPFSIFGADDWVEDRHRPRGGQFITRSTGAF